MAITPSGKIPGIGNSTRLYLSWIRSKIARPGQTPCVEHGLAPIGRPPVLPRAGLNPRYGIAAQTDSTGHQNNTLATTTSHHSFPIWQLPLRGKYQGLVTPPDFICHEYGQEKTTVDSFFFYNHANREIIEIIEIYVYLKQNILRKEKQE